MQTRPRSKPARPAGVLSSAALPPTASRLVSGRVSGSLQPTLACLADEAGTRDVFEVSHPSAVRAHLGCVEGHPAFLWDALAFEATRPVLKHLINAIAVWYAQLALPAPLARRRTTRGSYTVSPASKVDRCGSSFQFTLVLCGVSWPIGSLTTWPGRCVVCRGMHRAGK